MSGTLTLYNGFASTLCWLLSAFLVEQLGWRGACLTYAGIHLGFCLPMLVAGVPNAGRKGVHSTAFVASTIDHPVETSRERNKEVGLFVLLAAVLTLASIVMSVISVHMLTILQTARGLDLAAVVTMGAVIGPLSGWGASHRDGIREALPAHLDLGRVGCPGRTRP